MMRGMRLHYPVSQLSRMLNVSASGYYAWEGRLALEIRAAHRRTRED
jgi:hypothetical protein